MPAPNDFVLKVGTVNGSGSQTANLVLLRALFRMGVPCSGKNLFPSNIAGLPTWFEIRAHPRGWLARRRGVDLLVAMNPASAAQDLAEVLPGGVVVYDEPLALAGRRTDVAAHGVPFGKLVLEVCPEPRLRRLVVNMIYVGVVGRLLGLDRGELDAALARMLRGKEKALGLNRAAVDLGWRWAGDHLPAPCPVAVERPPRSCGLRIAVRL